MQWLVSSLQACQFNFKIKPWVTAEYFVILFRYLSLKFIYSEKTTKFCEISNVDLSYVVPVKSTAEISQNIWTLMVNLLSTKNIIDRKQVFQPKWHPGILSLHKLENLPKYHLHYFKEHFSIVKDRWWFRIELGIIISIVHTTHCLCLYKAKLLLEATFFIII